MMESTIIDNNFLKNELSIEEIIYISKEHSYSLNHVSEMQIIDPSTISKLPSILSKRVANAYSDNLDINSEDVILVDMEINNHYTGKTKILPVYANQKDLEYVKDPEEFNVRYRLGILAEDSSWEIYQKGRLIAYACKYSKWVLNHENPIPHPLFETISTGVSFARPIYSKQVIDEKVYKMHILAKQVLLLQENPWLSNEISNLIRMAG